MRGDRNRTIAVLCLALSLPLLGCAMNREVVEYGSMRVSDVDLGRNLDTSNRITDTSDDFRANETVYATVETEGNGNGTIRVKWIDSGRETSVRERVVAVGPGETVQVFTLAPVEGLAPGKWRLEVYLNDSFVKAEEFEVHS